MRRRECAHALRWSFSTRKYALHWKPLLRTGRGFLLLLNFAFQRNPHLRAERPF